MSKKTIVFKMPSPEAAGSNEQPGDSAPPVGGASVAAKGPDFAPSPASESDDWVRRGEDGPTADAPISPTPAAAQGAFPVDLAAPRNLGEVAALSVALPAMLGWFWLGHAMDRYRRMFTG